MSIKPTCKYQVHEMLGQGGYGTVYRTVNNATSKTYAIKVQTKTHIHSMIEIMAMRCLSTYSTNIISFIEILNNDQCIEKQEFGIVMPMAEMSLYDVIKNKQTIPNRKWFVYQLCSAVSYMHCAGILHLDIKPENILVYDNMRRFVLADFGLAMFSYTGYTIYSRRQRVTDGYAPPEIEKKDDKYIYYGYNSLTDSYSLGITFIYALTFISPYHDQNKYDWRRLIRDIQLKNVLLALTEPDYTKRESASSVFKLPFFEGEVARGVELYGIKAIDYERLSPIEEATNTNAAVIWSFWRVILIDNAVTLFALLRCIDLFYLIAPYITDVTNYMLTMVIDGTKYNIYLKDFDKELMCLAQSIENDTYVQYMPVSPVMMAWFKITNGSVYRRIISDISRDVKDAVNVIRNSLDSITYDQNRMLIRNKQKTALSKEDTIGQLTLFNQEFIDKYKLPPNYL